MCNIYNRFHFIVQLLGFLLRPCANDKQASIPTVIIRDVLTFLTRKTSCRVYQKYGVNHSRVMYLLF